MIVNSLQSYSKYLLSLSNKLITALNTTE